MHIVFSRFVIFGSYKFTALLLRLNVVDCGGSKVFRSLVRVNEIVATGMVEWYLVFGGPVLEPPRGIPILPIVTNDLRVLGNVHPGNQIYSIRL